jgi:hypothetical protein
LRRDERVRPSTATQIDDTLAVFQTAECERVRDPGERIGRCVGNIRELGGIVEVFGPGTPGGKNEVFLISFLRRSTSRGISIAISS